MDVKCDCGMMLHWMADRRSACFLSQDVRRTRDASGRGDIIESRKLVGFR